MGSLLSPTPGPAAPGAGPQAPSPQGEALHRRRLSILYEMYLDCVHTAKDLGRRAQRQEAV